MLIQVVYKDGKYDLVSGNHLTALIDSMEIIWFKRHSGWVSVPSPYIRMVDNRMTHSGPEQRLQIGDLDARH